MCFSVFISIPESDQHGAVQRLRWSRDKIHPMLRPPSQTPQILRDTLAAPWSHCGWAHPPLRAAAPRSWVEVGKPVTSLNILFWLVLTGRYTQKHKKGFFGKHEAIFFSKMQLKFIKSKLYLFIWLIIKEMCLVCTILKYSKDFFFSLFWIGTA